MRLGAGAPAVPGPEIARSRSTAQFGERLAAVPGVTVRGAVTSLPFTSAVGWGFINVEGLDAAARAGVAGRPARRDADYFRTMQIPLAAGTVLHRFDTADRRRIGRSHHRREIRAALLAQWRCDRQARLGRPEVADDDRRRRRHRQAVRARCRRPHRRVRPDRGMLPYHVARTSADPAAAAAAMVRAIHEVDPTMPVYDVQTMYERMTIRWRGNALRR